MQVFPVLPRPRLGARHYVRKHTRRYIKALFNNVVDFRDCTALNAAQLLCLTIATPSLRNPGWTGELEGG